MIIKLKLSMELMVLSIQNIAPYLKGLMMATAYSSKSPSLKRI